MTTSKHFIRLLKLKQHPEGGFYREAYRSSQKTRVPYLKSNRNWSTSIYFLLRKGEQSKLHRIRSDEIWHFYLGSPLRIIEITRNGKLKKTILGNNLTKKHRLQYVVPAGHWFGAIPEPGTKFSLVGCTVSPGFDFRDFELGDRANLVNRYPRFKSVITRLT